MSILKPRTATVPIYQGDDLERLADLRRTAEHAQRVVDAQARSGAPRRVGEEIASADAEKGAYDAFVAEAAERAVSVELRALGRKAFRALVADHPARTVKNDEGEDVDHEDDAGWGVNTETFPMSLLAYTDGEVRTIMAPDFSTSAQMREFLDEDLTDGDFDRLWQTAYYLNRSPGADPKASTYSTDSQSSESTST